MIGILVTRVGVIGADGSDPLWALAWSWDRLPRQVRESSQPFTEFVRIAVSASRRKGAMAELLRPGQALRP